MYGARIMHGRDEKFVQNILRDYVTRKNYV